MEEIAAFAAREAVRRGDRQLLRAAGLLYWSVTRRQTPAAAESATAG
jgi:hypothetical protein